MDTLRIGDYTLRWLRGGVTHLDGGAMFGVVPKALWSKKYPVNENNQIELRSDPILIQGHGKNILLEAGLGNSRFNEKQMKNLGITEESFVEEDLKSLGLQPEDIDDVLMTHMHFDHCAGLVKWENEQEVPVFAEASVHISRKEWEELTNPNIRSKSTYWKQNWKPIEHQVKLFDTELELLPGLKLQWTGGHSAGISLLTIEQEDNMLIHMADNMGTHAHQNVLWVMAYDDYPMDSIAVKQKYMDIGYNNEAWFTFYHDYKYRAIQYDSSGQPKQTIEKSN
ncbi:MBL fold metallo-hydrolase [Sinobaca sp. H24]|uniref:YtnP family quorum-quenching lactonase n=1 Tax=Sinobaca sp. H24 TaxID=2923376 RepID=UPI00207A11F7|nr:MBL fold metallo-hydrolase [Sinobaca sp. H24]